MKKIPLPHGKFTLVDDADFKKASKWKWQISNGYAMKSTGERIYLHQFILGRKNGFIVDHRNGDKLDNRRKNLRHCTRMENQRNQKIRNNTSGFKGVTLEKKSGKWIAKIQLGTFKKKTDAARAYNAAAKKIFKEFALTNPL